MGSLSHQISVTLPFVRLVKRETFSSEVLLPPTPPLLPPAAPLTPSVVYGDFSLTPCLAFSTTRPLPL